MNIVCIGGGPAGLYLAISMKLREPSTEVRVVERNRPDDTFGWGVVFSDQTLEHLRENDTASAERIFDNFAHWDDIDVHFKGQVVTSGGHGFSGISRKRLLNILQDRARELGVALEFEAEVEDLARYADADLIVASDGVNSKVRARYAGQFGESIDVRANKFIWLGTHKCFDAFTFIFEETEHGWIWVHAYRFDKNTSTFIVECQEPTWRGLGLDRLDDEAGIALCERIFEKYLDGHALMSNARHRRGSQWLNFPRVSCEHWHYKNIVLIGDAAHTAHFSIGSGTKLALEDAIELADMLCAHADLGDALDAYQRTRRLEVLKLQSAARNSTEWFENVPRYVHFEPLQFAYSLLTRSQRVSHENLRLRDRDWVENVERWFASHASRAAGAAHGALSNEPVPPMFTPFRLRGMQLMNRVVVSPMSMYSAEDGTPNDFHMVHYGARAQGGAGLVYTEMTDVEAEGRISPGCPGMYEDEHVEAWKRIVDFVHGYSHARIALQLGHAGPKGSTKRGWEGMDEPLDEGNWPIIGPSPVPWSERNQVPREMTREDMDRVKAAFVRATEMGEACGFDMIELHAAHGYLLSAFITPVTNKRGDEYGGSLESRLRFPLEVFRAMRAAWPQDKPMAVRVSATDWLDREGLEPSPEKGITPDDAVDIAKAFAEAGADVIDVSAGQTSTQARPVYGRMFQTPFSDRIRNEARIATMAVGNIYDVDHVNSIIAAGRADLCCLARPHLSDPYWTLRAAAQQGYDGVPWPVQYRSGKEQLERLLRRAGEMAIRI
ncbi:MAG: bifunctional salicylyl-CoA 5-hydroxylase/oxidoreductase [Gammaproteobacteria bacterium]|nr:bifunctional salicylyl-CoA 5-hydroxylase/oxidoreductase [Gammaproteobacteria bacterium]